MKNIKRDIKIGTPDVVDDSHFKYIANNTWDPIQKAVHGIELPVGMIIIYKSIKR